MSAAALRALDRWEVLYKQAQECIRALEAERDALKARVVEVVANPFRMTEAEWIAVTNALAREREEC